jgi:hypothetical protein
MRTWQHERYSEDLRERIVSAVERPDTVLQVSYCETCCHTASRLDVLGERFTIEVNLTGFVLLPLIPYSSKRVERVFSEVNRPLGRARYHAGRDDKYTKNNFKETHPSLLIGGFHASIKPDKPDDDRSIQRK